MTFTITEIEYRNKDITFEFPIKTYTVERPLAIAVTVFMKTLLEALPANDVRNSRIEIIKVDGQKKLAIMSCLQKRAVMVGEIVYETSP